MTREQLQKHIEERIEELRFYSVAYKAVNLAAQKFDGKVLNKRIDGVIQQNLRDAGYPRGFGRYSKEYSTKFKVYNPVGGKEVYYYIEAEDIVDGRFQYATWVKRQNPQSIEDALAKLYEALNHIQGIMDAKLKVEEAVQEYDAYLANFGLYSHSDIFKL